MIKCVASREIFGAVPTPARFSVAVSSCVAMSTIRLFTNVPIPDSFSFLLPLTPSNFADGTPTILYSNQMFWVV
jgi:hypothetical protein